MLPVVKHYSILNYDNIFWLILHRLLLLQLNLSHINPPFNKNQKNSFTAALHQWILFLIYFVPFLFIPHIVPAVSEYMI